MPSRHLRHLARPATILAGTMLLACGIATPLAGATGTIEFTTSPSSAPIALGPPEVKLGIAGSTVKFGLNADDKAALADTRAAELLHAKAAAQVKVGSDAIAREAAIQAALDDAQGNKDALRTEIEQRLVSRYQDGDGADLAFLLSGSGLGGLIDRTKVLKDQSSRDAQLAEDYTYSVARLEELKQVLDEIQQAAGERADNLTARADRSESSLVAARTAHLQSEATAQRAPIENEGTINKATGAAAANGTWYVMDGAFEANLYLPTALSKYDGGSTRFPKQAPIPATIARVLSDTRIQLDASGINDIQTGQIDERILEAMELAADRFTFVRITALKSDHGTFTSSGNVSEHSYGCAMDIGTIGSTLITPSAQVTGGQVEQAVLFFAGLGATNPLLAPHQVISLFDLGGATMALSDHGDHIHVGYHC